MSKNEAFPQFEKAFVLHYTSLQINSRGKVKVSGVLPDGTRLSSTVPLVCTDDRVCVPVVASAYSGKKGGIAFLVDLSEGGLIVDNVSEWIGSKGESVGSLEVVDLSSVSRLSEGEHAFSADISGFEIDGETIDDAFSPDGTSVTVSSGRWRVNRADTVRFVREEGYETTKDNGNPSGLKLTFTSKTGLFKGSFKLFGETDAGRSKKRTATVSGAVVNGIGYGSAYIRKIGGIPVVIE